jgi:GATA-binding protein
MSYATSSPAATSGQGINPVSPALSHTSRLTAQPVCQNCKTSTTPLWRRDEIGSVLCNACGLFLKLHGKPRPISLKTDVIKSRNRVKSSGQGPKNKVGLRAARAYDESHNTQSLFSSKFFDNGNSPVAHSDAGTPPPGSLAAHRRGSVRTSSAPSNGSRSPLSRATTPHNSHHLFDPALTKNEHLSSLPSLHLTQPTERPLAPSDPPTFDSLLASNTSLSTRVSELEFINGLFQGRVTELENSLRQHDTENERLRAELEQSRKREDSLKRRLDEVDSDGRVNGNKRTRTN